MIPTKKDITIWRGSSYAIELISQVKTYTYNTMLNDIGYTPTAADLMRTHKENLDYYGYTYAYLDFLSTYTEAEFIVRKSWIKNGQPTSSVLMKLTLTNDDLILSDKSVKIIIPADMTKDISFDSGNYELLLTIPDLINPAPKDQIDKLVYGSLIVFGDK